MEVLELLRTSGKSKAQLERDLGLYPGQLPAWQRTLAHDGEHAFPGSGHQTETDAELRRLVSAVLIELDEAWQSERAYLALADAGTPA